MIRTKHHFICLLTLMFLGMMIIISPPLTTVHGSSHCDENEQTADEWVGGKEECAEEGPSTGNTKSEEESSEVSGQLGNPIWLVVKLTFYTLLVVALIYLLIRFLAKKQKSMQHNKIFTNLGGTPLGQNRSLQMVKVGDRIYLLGVGEDISLIKEIDDPDQVNQLQREVDEQQSVRFPTWVERLKLGASQSNEGSHSSFQALLKNSLMNHNQKRNELEQRLNQNEDQKEGRS